MTAKRRAALKKAQLASARKRRQNRTNSLKNMKARRKARTPAQKRQQRKALGKIGRNLAVAAAVDVSKRHIVNSVGRRNPQAGAQLHTAFGVAELGYSMYALRQLSGGKKKKKKPARKKKK
jgi:hypothetical protein